MTGSGGAPFRLRDRLGHLGSGLLVLVALVVVPRLGRAADLQPPIMTHEPLAEAPRGRPVVIRARIEDESPVFAPALFLRPVGAPEYVAVRMTPTGEGVFEARIPASEVQNDIEYFLEAFDNLGNGPARVGSPRAPLRIRLVEPEVPVPSPTPPVKPKPEPPPPPVPVVSAQSVSPARAERSVAPDLLEEWWFWALIGTAVVGGATATVLALSGSDEPRDFLTVEVTGPNPGSGL